MIYGNKTLPELKILLPFANIRSVCGDGELHDIAKLFVRNTKFSNHHQKYLAVDEKYFMLCGVEINSQRQGWLQLNSDNFYWHEIGVSVACTSNMWNFVQQNFNSIVPPTFPLLSGGVLEHNVLCDMIRNAKACIHMETQICITSDCTLNRVFETVAERIQKSYKDDDDFKFILLTYNDFSNL